MCVGVCTGVVCLGGIDESPGIVGDAASLLPRDQGQLSPGLIYDVNILMREGERGWREIEGGGIGRETER